MKKNNGKTKAAYIIKILPLKIKTAIRNSLPEKYIQKLNQGLKTVENLNPADEKAILKEFIQKLNALNKQRKDIIDQSIIKSLMLLAIIVLFSFFYSYAKNRSVDYIINFIEMIFYAGGLHFVLLPFLSGYINAELQISSFKLLFSSKNYLLDIMLSIILSIIISLMFILIIKPVTISNPAIRLFSFVASVSAGPAIEEIFFRYLIFYRLGKKSGYIFSAILSSTVFALIHMPNSIPLFFIYFLSGIIFCSAYHFRKSIFPSFLTHAFSNLILQII